MQMQYQVHGMVHRSRQPVQIHDRSHRVSEGVGGQGADAGTQGPRLDAPHYHMMIGFCDCRLPVAVVQRSVIFFWQDFPAIER